MFEHLTVEEWLALALAWSLSQLLLWGAVDRICRTIKQAGIDRDFSNRIMLEGLQEAINNIWSALTDRRQH